MVSASDLLNYYDRGHDLQFMMALAETVCDLSLLVALVSFWSRGSVDWLDSVEVLESAPEYCCSFFSEETVP
jgi:hypothetical protein